MRNTQQGRGRRIEASDPARSLFLAKPTTSVPHKGGRRLDSDSNDYRLIFEWIQQGLTPPTADDAKLVRLEVSPAMALAATGDELPLDVRAQCSDGRDEDVTRWAKFSSADETVLQVSDAGQVKVMGPGDGSIIVWFSSQIVLARVTSPYPYEVPAASYDESPRRNFIDQLVLDKLKSLHVAPSD